MTDFGLSKGGLCAVLNAQREHIDRRWIEPSTHAVSRVQILETFAASMDNGHARFLGKLAFGSLGHNDLAQAMTQETLNLTQLQALYDKYWLEFEGMYKRAKLRKAWS